MRPVEDKTIKNSSSKIELWGPEPNNDYPSYDPKSTNCQKYVPTSEFIFDLYCMICKANQNLGIALRKAVIEEHLLVSKK